MEWPIISRTYLGPILNIFERTKLTVTAENQNAFVIQVVLPWAEESTWFVRFK